MAAGCVIFDFDGVIADTEALHLECYNSVLAAFADRVGRIIHISPQQYLRNYMVYGNREAFAHILSDAGIAADDSLLDELCGHKDQIFAGQLGGVLSPLPGVRELVEHLQTRGVQRGICSGARRDEIVPLLTAFGLERHFPVIVSIDDVRRSKPEPEGYNKAFDLLNIRADGSLARQRSVVFEDTAGGAAAAHAAGLKVIGVATTSSLREVRQWADQAVASLADVNLNELNHLLTA